MNQALKLLEEQYITGHLAIGELIKLINEGDEYRGKINNPNDILLLLSDVHIENEYEEIIRKSMTGKQLGQFFTPDHIKNKMLDLLDIQPNETVCDPSCGTAGFLVSALNREPTIKVYGREVEEFTYNLALFNMKKRGVIEHKDSINIPYEQKFDVVVANPPYGLKIKNNYDIKTENSEPLFIQLIINILNDNGRCAVILPNGSCLTSKLKQYKDTRKYLLESCNLQKVICVPRNEFNFTGIETAILVFTKGKKTTSVNFSGIEANISIDEIIANNYILHESYYRKNKGIKLLDIFELIPSSKHPASYGQKTGVYPFFTCSNIITKYTDKYDFDGEYLLLGSGGEPTVNYYNGKFSGSNTVKILKLRNELKDKYSVYLIFKIIRNNLSIIGDFYTGIGLKHLTVTALKNINIPYNDSLDINKMKTLELEITRSKNKTRDLEIELKTYLDTLTQLAGSI